MSSAAACMRSRFRTIDHLRIVPTTDVLICGSAMDSCGQRMRLLSEPLDLSSQAGVYLDCEADADAPRRAYKVALRTKQDRGEVVYQAQAAAIHL